jgi:MFS family permease
MGATIPIGMRAIRQTLPREAGRSFSYLYTANVAGAALGTALPLLLIELMGFRGTLWVGAACNVAIAVGAIGLSMNPGNQSLAESVEPPAKLMSNATSGGAIVALLFLTGLRNMGMEVVWVREFTPYLGTVVYAFAGILGVYVTATFIGSRGYRRWSSRLGDSVGESPLLWTLLGVAALLPLLMSSPDIQISKTLRGCALRRLLRYWREMRYE